MRKINNYCSVDLEQRRQSRTDDQTSMLLLLLKNQQKPFIWMQASLIASFSVKQKQNIEKQEIKYRQLCQSVQIYEPKVLSQILDLNIDKILQFLQIMKPKQSTLLCLLLLSILVTSLNALDILSFDNYLTKFDKEYSATEKAQRLILFNARVTKLQSLDDDTTLTYQVGFNNFSDWTAAQIAKLKGYLSNRTENSAVSTVPDNRVGAPSTVDWSKSTTQPKSQGRCGSCWAFAAVAYSESKLIIDGREDRDVDLSEQRLLQCTKDSSCNGGYMEEAMKQVLDDIPSEFFYSYSPFDFYGSPICTFPGTSIGFKAQNYYDLSDTELEELVAQRPIVISVNADGWENYESGIYQCELNLNSGVNHAVLLVGYTSEYWHIKNSWGKNWGEDGFIKVTRSTGRDCGIKTSAFRTFQMNPAVILSLLLLFGTFLL